MVREKIKKVSGTILEYSVTSVMILCMVLMLVSLFMKRYTIENFDLYTDRIGREIVVCDSLEAAERKAREKAEDYFDRFTYIDTDRLSVNVYYQIGADQSWHKGSFIVLTISGPIKSVLMIGETRYESSVTVMIEHN